jgi:ribonuclease HII
MHIGVDEAGRGPLAGPVCAAAVILNPNLPLEGLADSKSISETKRNRLAPLIQTKSLAWGIGWATVSEIEAFDILRASFMAMSRAVEDCLRRYSESGRVPITQTPLVRVDGNHSPGDFEGPWSWPYPTQAIIKGDQTEPSISAASILAKTARDCEMRRLHSIYPDYGFDRHAGYGTRQHLAALDTFGVTPIHRKTFAPIARRLALKLDPR